MGENMSDRGGRVNTHDHYIIPHTENKVKDAI